MSFRCHSVTPKLLLLGVDFAQVSKVPSQRSTQSIDRDLGRDKSKLYPAKPHAIVRLCLTTIYH